MILVSAAALDLDLIACYLAWPLAGLAHPLLYRHRFHGHHPQARMTPDPREKLKMASRGGGLPLERSPLTKAPQALIVLHLLMVLLLLLLPLLQHSHQKLNFGVSEIGDD